MSDCAWWKLWMLEVDGSAGWKAEMGAICVSEVGGSGGWMADLDGL